MIICMHYNDQVWDQDGWMLAEFLVCIFLDWDEAEVYNNKKIKWGYYPAMSTKQACSRKDLLCCENILLYYKARMIFVFWEMRKKAIFLCLQHNKSARVVYTFFCFDCLLLLFVSQSLTFSKNYELC